MSDTVFVTMYNPNLGNVQVDAPLQAVSTYASHGWLLLDPQATPPPVASPYLSQPAADSRYLRDWAGAEVLTAGAVRVAPDGHIIVRTADGTTRPTYDATEQALWTAIGGQTAAQLAADPALRAAYVPKWKPSTAYASGEYVLNPSGQIVSANSAFTSGTTYSASNWTVVSGGGSSYTDEQAQDAVAAMFAAGTDTGITFVYDDAGNRIGATVSDATKAPLLTPTAIKTTAYTAAVGDMALMNVPGGATTLTLPTAPADKAQVGYRAIGATAAAPLTINRGGSTDTIGLSGATSAPIVLADEIVVLQYDAPNTRWSAVSNVKTQASLDARYSTAAPTRRAMAVLSTPMTTGQLKNAEIHFRTSSKLPSATTRWRIRIRNYDCLAETAITTGASFVGIYHGQQALDANGQPTGAFTAAPSQAVGAFTLPADGSEYISAWITAGNNQISANLPWLFSFAYTGGDTVTGQASGAGEVWYNATTGAAANVAQTAATGLTTYAGCPFDIRIEYDTVTASKVCLFVGDSLTFGGYYGAALMPRQFAYPEIWAARTSNPALNGGVPSATAQQWAGATTLWKYQRFDPTNVPVDQAVIFIGTNDLGVSATLANLKTWLVTIIGNLRALGVGRFIIATIPPRNFAHGVLTKPAAISATTLVLGTGTLSAGSVQLGEGPQAETVTLSASPTANGDGTYTYTTTATAKAHVIGEVVAQTQETVRLGYNAFARGTPGGAAACASTDLAWTAGYDPALPRQEFVQTDNLHPTFSGAARLAETIPG